MIIAIFFDIDGTLLSYKTHSVLDGTVQAFQALKKKGILTFISSGRPKVLIPPMPLHFDGYITVNGGLCFAGDKILLRNPINTADCQRWLQYVEENHKTTMCFTENEMFINQIDSEVLSLHGQLGFNMPPVYPLEQIKDKEVFQFIAMQPQDQDEAVLELLPNCRMPRWHPLFTDLIPSDSSKAVGIQSLLTHFGINKDETMAFGDGANDIEMLQYVKYGIAMGNASPHVKRHASYVTDTADNDGILKALQYLNVI